MNEKLTAKEEMFIQGIVSGLSQREAYKQAYNTSRMKDETIDVKACNLFKKDKVRIRYNELIDEHKEKALYTREEMVNDLIWIKEKAREDINNPKKGLRQANANSFLNAVKELGELEALYPAKKQDIKVEGNIENNNPFKDMTTEQLIAILKEDD